jgi:hypothetical protein
MSIHFFVWPSAPFAFAIRHFLESFFRKALEEYIKNQENKIREGYGFTYDRPVIFKIHYYSFDCFMKLVLFSFLLESPGTSSESSHNLSSSEISSLFYI